MMTKSERFFSMSMGIGCTSIVLLVAKHVFQPSEITQAVANAIAVTATCFIGFVGYDSIKEALTGRKG